jgi:cupin 2 domain-containing protein
MESAMLPAVHSFKSSDSPQTQEIATVLLEGRRFRAEHIASYGAVSLPDFWYDQTLPEWVALLSGTATLEFENGTLDLQTGDYLIIPANLKHRVSAASADATWFALHFETENS